MSFLPATREELRHLGWSGVDVVLVTGDAYIDSPLIGVSLIGKTLTAHGFKVAVISQPDVNSDKDILRLGVPKLFWGVTAGAVDSLVANYTALGKPRKRCDMTPGGLNNKRPDRATIVYSHLIRRFDKKATIVLGGIEASLRRFSHYDSLQDTVRRSILVDAKADYLIYGMGERAVVALAAAIRDGRETDSIENLVYRTKTPAERALPLPSFEEVKGDKSAFHRFFHTFYKSASTLSGKTLAQKTGDFFVVQTPPHIFTSEELDDIYSLDFENALHPLDAKLGAIGALETIKNSIATHRGCFGECAFCAIAAHQGRMVVSRSADSIIYEAKRLAQKRGFNGIIKDVGGPTANMYGSECGRKPCANKSCLYPAPCDKLQGHRAYLKLLEQLAKIKGIKRVFIASGIRADLAERDKECGESFIKALAEHYTGGQIKLAPEHTSERVLRSMKKNDSASAFRVAALFREFSKKAGKEQFATFYLMAAHPGCERQDMEVLARFIRKNLSFTPEQVQIFTPTPSTLSTCAYCTGLDSEGKEIYSAKSLKEKTAQKRMVIDKPQRT